MTTDASRPETGEQPWRGYMPTLDGWRAMAIAMVILYHDGVHRLGPLSDGWVATFGYYGVDLFFAISGLLICSKLLDEEESRGSISLRSFYVRRAFRILPPALAFTGVVGALGIAGILPVSLREWLASVFFYRNYTSLAAPAGSEPFFTSHLWSLSVEEHFYLVLPFLLVFTRKRWRIPVLASIALAVEAHRAIVLETRPWMDILHHTDIRLDALMVPAIFAVLFKPASARAWLAKRLRTWPLAAAAAAVLVTYWTGDSWQTIVLVFIMPAIILGSVLNPSGRLALLLELAPVRYIGRISYGLYLWQQLFFVRFYPGGSPLGILENTPLRYVATFGLAAASYHLLERPLIRLGHRLSRRVEAKAKQPLGDAPRQFQRILGIRFFVGSAESAIDEISRTGGLVVVPSAPTMKDVATDPVYREAVLGADFAIADSSLMVALWNLMERNKVPKLSGLKYLRALIEQPTFRVTGGSFWVMPNRESLERARVYLHEAGMEVDDEDWYLAPMYCGNFTDPELVARIERRRPRHVLLAVGGGTQEQLGYYLKRTLNCRPAIHCIGAAIGFLTGDQVAIPVWTDRFGLGWLWRCISKPKRYIPRYWRARVLTPLLLRYRDRLPPLEA